MIGDGAGSPVVPDALRAGMVDGARERRVAGFPAVTIDGLPRSGADPRRG
jgi:hypothetical protein